MNRGLADALAALLFAGILTCWAPGYWPVALVQSGAFLLLARVLVEGRPLHADFVALPVIGLVVWGAWQLIAGTSAYKFETGKSVLYWAANAAVFFFYLGGKLIRAARWCIFSRRLDVFSTLFAYGLLRAMWHLAFSPFAGHARLDVALAAVIVVLLGLEKRSRRSMIAT